MVAPPIAILVLAAGRSSRTAPAHKLLACDAAGQTMLARTMLTALNSRANFIISVLPPDRPELGLMLSTSLPPDPRLRLCTCLLYTSDAAD